MKNESISIIISNINPQTTQVLLEGDLVIRNAKDIKKELVLALSKQQNINLVFRNIVKIDLSVIQLLIALQKSSIELEKKVLIDFEMSEDIKVLMENSGLDKVLFQE